MSKNKSELDICPFCGSDTEIVEVHEGKICVRCMVCDKSVFITKTKLPKNKSKLDICPFCGSDAELVEIDVGQFCVRCKQCNSSTDYYGTELGARASWDDRRGYNKKRIARSIAFDFIVAGIYVGIVLLLYGITKLF